MNRAQRLYAAIEKGQVTEVFEHLWAAVGQRDCYQAQMAWLTTPQGEAPFALSDLLAYKGALQEALFRSMSGSEPAVVRTLSALEAHLAQHGHHRLEAKAMPLFHIEQAVSKGAPGVVMARLAYEDPTTLAPLVVRAARRGNEEILALVRPYASSQSREEAHGVIWSQALRPALGLLALLGEDPLQPEERLLRLIEDRAWLGVDAYASAPACPRDLAQAALRLVAHRSPLPHTLTRVREDQLRERPAPLPSPTSRRRA